MATAELFSASFGSQWGLVSLALTYDTTTLQVQQLTYGNPSPETGVLILTGPLNRTIVAPANANSITDLTSFNIVCISQQVTDKFGTRTEISLPAGENIGFTWPSAG